MAPAMPCKISKNSQHGVTPGKPNELKSKLTCILEVRERDKPWRHRSGHVKHSSMHKELSTPLTATHSQEWTTKAKVNETEIKLPLESNRWQTAPTKEIWARIEPGELRTDAGSKIQEWRLHACANCGEIRHLLDHWVRRSANSWHSDRECQRSPTEASQNLQLSGRPRCLAGRPQGRSVIMERCVPLNNKLWIDEHVCKYCKVWMSGVMAWYGRCARHTYRETSRKNNNQRRLALWRILKKNKVQRLKARNTESIHETHLLYAQSMHDLRQGPKHCSPANQGREIYQKIKQNKTWVLSHYSTLHVPAVSPWCSKCCSALPSHDPYVSFKLISLSPDFNV